MANDGLSVDYSKYTVASNNTSSASASAAQKKKVDGALNQAQFLKLMTAQMTHQDPSQPMQNGEFLTQMAQFGTVSGIQDLQKSFSEFADKITSDQTLQASALVGHDVLTPTKKAVLESGGTVEGSIDLNGSTTNLALKITDSKSGKIINSLSLGEHKQGSVPFTWDGLKSDGSPAEPGVYKIEATADIEGKNTVLESFVRTKVDSVSLNTNGVGVKINLAGGQDSVTLNQIRQIY